MNIIAIIQIFLYLSCMYVCACVNVCVCVQNDFRHHSYISMQMKIYRMRRIKNIYMKVAVCGVLSVHMYMCRICRFDLDVKFMFGLYGYTRMKLTST